MPKLEQYINAHFQIIQPNQLTEVSALFKEITLRKGGYFPKEGKIYDNRCFIKSVFLRVLAAALSGRNTKY